MPRIAWYLKRARVMTAREFAYRIGQQLTLLSLLGQHMFGVGIARALTDISRSKFCRGKQARLPPLTFDPVGLKAATATLLNGEMPVAGRTWKWDAAADIWHRAPDTGRRWPMRFFASIHYREGNRTGDVRQLWEPSRLQQLVNLAIIARNGSDDERRQAKELAQAQLASWVDANPPLVGANYISAMECALRIIAVCHALDLLREDFRDDASWVALFRIVGSHAPLIERRLSLHSSTGNHTIAEAAGLVYAGLLFPEMSESSRWLNKGRSILVKAASTQVLPDGGGAEQAFWYHLFNVQLLALVKALLEHDGGQAPGEISSAVDRGTGFLATMSVTPGKLPAIGDGDGGYALSRFLCLPGSTGEPTTKATIFRDSGYTVENIASEPSIKLVFDHGPLGMPPAYGHGHADALSLLLSVNGEDAVVDPGTYTYTGDQDWRRYFRSTRAHNTVTVDGNDQAQQDGCFLWSKPFRARLLDSAIDGTGGRLLAEHDGYRAIGVRHVRGIAWNRDQWLLVWDELTGEGTHELALHWHLASEPHWHDAENFDLPVYGGSLTIRCLGGRSSTHRGEREPILGWRSPAYGTIEPIWTVRLCHRATLPHDFTTVVRLPGGHIAEPATQDALAWIKDRARRAPTHDAVRL